MLFLHPAAELYLLLSGGLRSAPTTGYFLLTLRVNYATMPSCISS